MLFARSATKLATEDVSMFRKLIATDTDIATTILRLALGVIFFAHGAQKMLGWFGGYGFTGTMGFFTGAMHIPALFAFLAIAAEFFGGLGLIFGFLTRIAAFGIFSNMLVAIALIHHHFGFFMNWTGAPRVSFARACDYGLFDDSRRGSSLHRSHALVITNTSSNPAPSCLIGEVS
jgi:putative oxidoreductase